MIKSYKFRLYPNKAQAEKLQWVLDRCRELYNTALQERKEAWKYEAKSISYFDQCHSIVEIKTECRPEYQEIDSQVLKNVLMRMDKAYKCFFQRVRSGYSPGYPRFQGYNRYNSFTYPGIQGWRIDVQNRPLNKKGIVRANLKLTKIGTIKLHLHRDIVGETKTVTLKREEECWYAVFCCEIEQKAQYHPSEEAVGIDLGLLHFATLSTGETIENPRCYRKAEANLKRSQQNLSKKRKKNDKAGCKGNRRKKAVKAVAKAHRKVRNQRQDFLHKASRNLVKQYQTIVFEDLTTANLVRRPKPKQDEETGQYLPNGASQKAGLNKSILDAGWAQFVGYCEYKAEWAGTRVVKVNPKYTSQICSGCGAIVKKELSERRHVCSCGRNLDRDHNAAINILRLGLRA